MDNYTKCTAEITILKYSVKFKLNEQFHSQRHKQELLNHFPNPLTSLNMP